MITLSQPSKSERAYTHETSRPTESVETAGSLAMLFEDGLMTMGQYDEFISSNPFAVDYSMYTSSEGTESIALGGFLSDFASAVSTIDAAGSFSTSGFSGGCTSAGCGGFTSFC